MYAVQEAFREALFSGAFIQQLLDLMERPCRAAVGQPLGVGRWITNFLIRRITPRSGAWRRVLGSG
jgi:hypothetical protein